MSQRSSGLHGVLGVPAVYDAFQRAVGVRKARRIFIDEYVAATADCTVLDVGCGTGELLDFLPAGVNYIGFDLSAEYIAEARYRRGHRGRFECSDVRDFASMDIPPVDVATFFGVLHHLNDNVARDVLGAVARRLRHGGRLVTIDPAYSPGQSWVARQVISRDRGECVRAHSALAGLFPDEMVAVTTVRHDMLAIPYTHAVVVAVRSDRKAEANA